MTRSCAKNNQGLDSYEPQHGVFMVSKKIVHPCTVDQFYAKKEKSCSVKGDHGQVNQDQGKEQ